MLMADTMAVFFVVLGLMVSLVGLCLLFRGLFPSVVLAGAERAGRGITLAFVVGAPILFFSILTAALVSNLPGRLGTIGSGLVLCSVFAFLQVGVAALATRIGAALTSPRDEKEPWRATMRGGIVLVLSFLLPIFGWFVLLPFTAIVGAGLSALTLVGQLIPRRLSDHVEPQVRESELVFGSPSGTKMH